MSDPKKSSPAPPNLIRRIVGRIRRGLRSAMAPVERFMRTRALKSARWAARYYCLFSTRFDREQQAFLAGQQRYQELLRSPEAGFALLRRNTHRLEKGLTMQPRKDVFARDYIAETVAAYARAVSVVGSSADSDEIRWAHDVLQEFFRVTGSDPVLDKARREFDALPQPVATKSTVEACDHSPLFIPYRRSPELVPSITIEEMEKLARFRRSVRWFLPRPVERSKIDRAIAVASQAPSACNRQPFVFRVFDDPELVRKVAAVPMGTAGYEHNIPVFVVIVGRMRNYFDERDRHLIYIDSSLAAMSLVFAAEVQGLSTCCINWPDVEDKEQRMAELLKLDQDERPIMCLALGYPDPDGLVAFSQKKTVEQLRQYN